MTAKKHVQQALTRARCLGCECSAKQHGGSGHYTLTATKGGVTVAVPISGNPKQADACVNMVIQMLRRRFLERGVEL